MFLFIDIVLPQIVKDIEKPDVRNVEFTFSFEGKSLKLNFDKDMGDRIATFIPNTISENGLPQTASAPLEECLRSAFRTERERAEEGYNKLMDEIKAMGEKAALLEQMKLIKFYPRHPLIDLKKYMSPRVNRYYGDASSCIGGDILEVSEERRAAISAETASREQRQKEERERERERVEREKAEKDKREKEMKEKAEKKETQEAEKPAKRGARRKAKNSKEEQKEKKEEGKDKKATEEKEVKQEEKKEENKETKKEEAVTEEKEAKETKETKAKTTKAKQAGKRCRAQCASKASKRAKKN